MNKTPLMFLLSLFLSDFAYATKHDVKFKEITVPNLDHDSPACRIRLAGLSLDCTDDSCEVPAPKASTLASVHLSFSCIPSTAPTGFENPPPYAKVFPIRTQNADGHVSSIDELAEEPGDRMRELYFCLYGRAVRFCGFAKTLRLKDGESADATSDVLKLVKTIVLQEVAVSK